MRSNRALLPQRLLSHASTFRRISVPLLRCWNEHWRYLAALGALTLLAGLPLFQFRLMMGHDSAAYVPRAVEFWEVLRDGEILPRWAPDFGAGHGEPTFNFHPPLPQYLNAFFHALGFTFIASENLAAFALLALAGFGMYVLANEFFGKRGALVAATAYLFAPYLQSRLYVSHALADYSAFAFIPLAFWGLHGAVKGSWPRWLVAMFGAVGIMLTSVPVAFIVYPALALFVAAQAWLHRSWDGMARGVWCLTVALGVTAFFWLPALTETKFVHIDRREARIDYHGQFLEIWQLVHSSWGYGLSVPGTGDGLSFALGAVHLTLTVAALLLLRRIWRASPDAGVMLVVVFAYSAASVFMLTSSSAFIWERVSVLPPFQFPWRYLSFLAFATSLASGAVFAILRPEWRRAANWLMIGMIAAILLLNLQHAKPQGYVDVTDEDFSPRNIASKGLATTAREFEPIDVVEFPPAVTTPMTVVAGRALVAPERLQSNQRTFHIDVQEDALLRDATFYFPGWTLYVDGKREDIFHANANGLIEFPLIAGSHDVRLVFEDTPVRAWSERLSALALILALCTVAAPSLWRARRRVSLEDEALLRLMPAVASSQPGGQPGVLAQRDVPAVPPAAILVVSLQGGAPQVVDDFVLPPRLARLKESFDALARGVWRLIQPGADPVSRPHTRRWWLRPFPDDREHLLAWAFVAFAAGFNAYYMRTEVTKLIAKVNDGALHEMLLGRTLAALKAHQDPTDAWFAPVTAGYPVFHHYQHLPFLPPAVVAWVFPIGITTVYQWTLYLLLCAFPISVYWSMRRIGFPPIAAGLGALVAPVISTDGLFGFDNVSYVWRGFGLYTQLWAMVLLPPALAQGYHTLRHGGGYFWSVALLSAVLLSHLVLGYIAVVTLAAFVLLDPTRDEVWRRGRRLSIILIFALLVSSYFLSGVLLDNAYLARSVYEEKTKYDGFGAEWTLRALVDGCLFDDLRFQWLTMIVLAGVGVCALRWRDERYRIPAVIGVLWLLMYFGRPTWGVLSGAATLNVNFYVHRLIAGVHLGGILLMGVALAVPWRWALTRRRVWYLLVPAAITILLLFPVYNERREYLQVNVDLMEYNADAFANEQPVIDAMEAELRKQPPGRVYAGLPGRWGKDYRVASVPISHLLSLEGFDMIGYFYYPFSLNADIIGSLDEGRADHYNLFNIRYVVAPPDRIFDPNLLEPLAEFGKFKLYRVLTTGYFDLVDSDVTFEGDKDDHFNAAIWWLASALPAVKQHPAILFDGGPTQGVGPFPLADAPAILGAGSFDGGPPRGEILSERVGLNSYVAQVNVLRPSMVMLKETFHPGWHVTVDGRETETVMLMPSYLGVRVGPGSHLVRFEYRPPASRYALMALGLLALTLLAVAEGLVPFVRRRFSAPPEATADPRPPLRP